MKDLLDKDLKDALQA